MGLTESCDIRDAPPESLRVLMNHRLLYAAQDGCTSDVRQLIARDADVNTRRQLSLRPTGKGNSESHIAQCVGLSPLMYAAQGGHTKICEILLARNAKIEAEDDDGWTPIIFAANQHHRNTVRLLFSANANISAMADVGATLSDFIDDEEDSSDLLKMTNYKIERGDLRMLLATHRNDNKPFLLC
eukprot:GEMP01068876.1.p1 GENE.GEMP01068876.1~~GEMP01068876.1.p1  ORF type:complete len:185 (+),score=36.09 GEMP01068876.1:133-687(+)